MYLLDTDVVSEARKAGTGKAHPAVIAWLESFPGKLFYISVITLYEIELGVLLMERKDPAQGRAMRLWMEDGVKNAFRGRTLAADEAVSLRAAALNVPDPRPLHDCFIGATAIEHRYCVVTRNVRDFQGMNIDVLNPWDIP